MLEFMEYDLWIDRTKAGISKPRSKALKAIDSALKAYHTQGKSDRLRLQVETTLNAWLKEKGSNWRNTIRNKNGGVADLVKQVNDDFVIT